MPDNNFPPGGIADQMTRNGGFILPKVSDYTGTEGGVQAPSPRDYYEQMMDKLQAAPSALEGINRVIPLSPFQVDTSGRYPKQLIGADNEDLYAQGQTWYNKLGNDAVKMLGLAGTTFLQGTVGLINGVGQWIADGRFASLYDNDLNHWLDGINQKLDNKLPNYYSAQERAADWYSPSNWFTANFFFDKVMKNLGFSLGAAAGGFAWGTALKGIGLTGQLIKSGEGMLEAATKLDAPLQAIPQAERAQSFLSSLKDIAVRSRAATLGNVLTKSDRILTAALGTAGEASMEALNNLNEFRNNLISDYEKQYGYKPTGQDLQAINDQADHVGNASFLLNIALLTGTNYIQFPKILNSSYKAERGVVNDAENAFVENVSGTAESALPKGGFAKRIYQAKNIASLLFNPAEAFEEGAQFTIQEGTEDYYNKAYKGQENSFLNSLGTGVDKTLHTKEGIENILIGGLSGALQTSGIPPFHRIPGVNKVFGGESALKERGWTGYGGERVHATNTAIQALNKSKFQDYLKDAASTESRANTIQADRESAIRQGDILESKDLEHDFAHNYLAQRIKYGRYDFVKQDIAQYKQAASTQEGFEQLQQDGYAAPTDTRESFLQRLNNFEQHAEHVKALYDGLNLKYSGLINKETKERVYSPEVIDKMVYAASKVADYDKRIPQLSNGLLNHNISVQEILNKLAENPYSKETSQVIKEAKDNIEALDILQEEKDGLKTNLKDLTEASLRRKNFLKEYDTIRNNPDRYTTRTNEQGERVTKTGLKKRTTAPAEEQDGYRPKLPSDSRTLQDIIGQYGEGEQSQKEVLNKVLDSPYATKAEKELARQLLEKTTPEDTIHLNDTDLPVAGAHIAGNTSVNYEAASSDYEKGTTPVESIILSQLAKKYDLQEAAAKTTEITKEDLQKEQDEIKKAEEEISKLTIAQKGLQQTSGTLITPAPTGEETPKEDSFKKNITRLFGSTTANNERLTAHQVREQQFLIHSNFHPKRANLRMMLVTVNNEEALGLKGLAKFLTTGTAIKVEDPQAGPIAAVYVEQDGKKYYFLDEKGERLEEVGKSVDLNKITIGTLTTADLNWSAQYGKGTRYSGADPDTAEAYSKQWQKRREEIFSFKDHTEYHPFNISRGIAIHNKNGDHYEANAVVGTLIPEGKESILDQADLVQVSTGEITLNGETVNIPAGRTVFKYGSTLEYLNNRLLTKEEATTIFEVIKKATQSVLNKQGFPEQLRNYIQGLVYMGRPTNTNGTPKPLVDNNIFFEGPNWHFGRKSDTEALHIIPFSPEALDRNRDTIINFLQNTYNNVNNYKLSTLKDVPFEEITGFKEDGTPTIIQWKSYQHYLLQEKTPDGGKRAIPLTTSIQKITKENPRNYKYKYAWAPDMLGNVEIPQVQAKPAVLSSQTGNAVQNSPATKQRENANMSPKIDDFILDGVTKNIFKGKNGDVPFTASVKDGAVSVSADVPKEVVDKIAANKTAVQNVIVPAVKAIDPSITDEREAIASYVTNSITITLQQQYDKEQAAKEDEKPPIVQPGDKKADIERRNKILDDRFKDRLEALKNRDLLLATHFLLSSKGLQNEFGSDTSLLVNRLKISYKDAEALVQKHLKEIKPENWKLGDDYDNSKLDKRVNEVLKEINAKYDAELAALENQNTSTPTQEDIQKRVQERINKAKGNTATDSQYRTVVSEHYKPGNIEKEAQYIAEKIGIPVHIVNSIIEKMGGGYAFGKLQDAAITLFNAAEEGTGYHEAFEAVWNLFATEKERQKHLKEFSRREGSFIDYETGQQVNYSEANPYQAKEKMAEEFRSFVLTGETPPRPKTNFIGRFFQNLKNWIHQLFSASPSDIADMFRKIDTGYYKEASIVNFHYKPEYNSITGLDAADSYNIIRGTAAKVFQRFAAEGGSFTEFDSGFPALNHLFDQVYKDLQADLDQGILEGKNHLAVTAIRIEDSWEQIKKLTIEYLKSYNLVVPEEDEDREAEESNYASGNGDSYVQNSFKWDGKRNAPASIRLLFATITESMWGSVEGKVRSVRDDSTYMERMIESGRMFNQTLHEIGAINDIKQKEKRLIELSLQYPNYVRLINSLHLNLGDEALNSEDVQLRIKLFNTFSKQRPVALKIVKEEGRTYLKTSNSSDAQARLKTDWVDSLKSSDLVSYDTEEKLYKIKAQNIPDTIKTADNQIAFLNSLKIPFTKELRNKLSDSEKDSLATVVGKMRTTLKKNAETPASSVKALGLESAYKTLASLYFKASGELPESTYLSIEGERKQEFIQNSTVSTWVNDINNAGSLEELYQVLPHLTTNFAKGSNYITEKRIQKSNVFSIEYIEGVEDNDNDRVSTVDSMSEPSRLLSEINANLHGHFYILLPADSKTEWMMKTTPLISYTEMSQEGLWEKVQGIVNGYYSTEKELHTLDGKNRLLHIVNGDYSKDSLSQKELKEFFDNLVKEQKDFLQQYGIIKETNNKFSVTGIDTDFTTAQQLNEEALTKQELYNILLYRTLNYAFNNIEMQKIFFGDPAAYGSLDNMLKRYKSFLSPRETSLYNWDHFNSFANTEYNVSGTQQLQPTDFGYHNYKDHMDTITLSSVIVNTASISEDESLPDTIRNPYKKGDATDAQSWAPLPGYREIRQKRGFDWKRGDEAQYQYNMARDRQEMLEDGLLDNTTYRKELQEADKAILKKGNPRSGVFQVLKPIGSGYTIENNPFLDKTSVVPLSYHSVRGSHLAEKYVNMVKQGISYAIVDSGRKIGAEKVNDFYTEDNWSITRIPFRYYGIQTETGGAHDSGTVGSQVSKLVELNIYQNGVPSDFKGTTEQWFALSPEQRVEQSKRHRDAVYSQSIRKEMVKNGYTQLLKKLGIAEDGAINLEQIEKLLQDELFRREVADNIRGALSINPATGQWTVPLEALNNYAQIRAILYSYVNKFIAKPKVNGGPKVQVSGTGFEAAGYRVELSKDSKGNPVYISSGLKFYERKDGTIQRMEVLLPAWFMRKFPGKTEQEVMEIVNSSPDKADILSGVGFRIPTQEMNSIEAFIVKGFLPAEHGDTIVVPEAITTKAGSDFDVDKLNTYLKNIYLDKKTLRIVPYFESRQEADEFFTKHYEERLARIKRYENFREKLISVFQKIEGIQGEVTLDSINTTLAEDEKEFYDFHVELLQDIIEQAADKGLNPSDYIEKQITRLGKESEQLIEKLTGEEARQVFLDRMYTQSLENEYFRSLEKLILHPDNYERLVKPNSAEKLKGLAINVPGVSTKENVPLSELAPHEFGNQSTASTLSPLFMSRMRHDFILSKGWVGITAVHNTNNALNQKAGTFIDPKRFAKLSDPLERAAIGDGVIHLPHNTITIKGETYATLAGGKDQEEEYISDGLSEHLDGAVDAAKGAWLSKIVQNTDVLPVHLLLRMLGVPRAITAYFVNQPIIREYQKLWAQRGADEFKDQVLEKLQASFGKQDATKSFIVNKNKLSTHLQDKIASFYNDKKLSAEENKEQWFILNEFFKYEAMAKNLRRFIQATTYDTANFSDSNLLELKEYQSRDAQDNNVFSSVANILNSSFIGEIKDNLRKGVNALSNIFVFDQHLNRNYITPVLDQLKGYIKGQERYSNAARAVERNFIQHLIQLSTGLNNRLPELLKNKETAITTQLQNLKLKQSNLVVSALKQSLGNTPTSTKNVSLLSRAFDVFTSNIYTAALNELKNNPHTRIFYNNLLDAAFLQAGISTQFNSLSDIIPNEDFKEKIFSAIQALNDPAVAKTFTGVDAFFRNSWANKDLVPRIKQKWGEDYQTGRLVIKNQLFLPWLSNVGVPFAYRVDTRSLSSNAPYVTLSQDKPEYSREQKQAMRKRGDYSYKETVLLRKIDGIPDQYYNQNAPHIGTYRIFVPVNAWGDAQRAQEYYSTRKPSVLDNNTYKPGKELTNEELVEAFYSRDKKLNSGNKQQNVPEIGNSQIANSEQNKKSENQKTQDQINKCLGGK